MQFVACFCASKHDNKSISSFKHTEAVMMLLNTVVPFTLTDTQKIRLPWLKKRAKAQGRFKLNLAPFDYNNIERVSRASLLSTSDRVNTYSNFSRLVQFYLGHIKFLETPQVKQTSVLERLSNFKITKALQKVYEAHGLFITTLSVDCVSKEHIELKFIVHSNKKDTGSLTCEHNNGAFYTKKDPQQTNIFEARFLKNLSSGYWCLDALKNVRVINGTRFWAYPHANIDSCGECCFGYHTKKYTDNFADSVKVFTEEFVKWFKNFGLTNPYHSLTSLKLYKKSETTKRLLQLKQGELFEINNKILAEQNNFNEADYINLTKVALNGDLYLKLNDSYKNLVDRKLMSVEEAHRAQETAEKQNNTNRLPVLAIGSDDIDDNYDDDDYNDDDDIDF